MARSLALPFLLLFLACGGGDDDAAGVAEQAAPGTAERYPDVMPPRQPVDYPTDFQAACTRIDRMTPELCQCIGKRARQELQPATFDFLVASLAGNKKRVTRLREKLSQAEQTRAGTFMATATAACAQQTGIAPAKPRPRPTPRPAPEAPAGTEAAPAPEQP